MAERIKEALGWVRTVHGRLAGAEQLALPRPQAREARHGGDPRADHHVAAFNIVSTLTMVVRDKTREIGILKAMGMRRDSIRRIFLLQGAFIGAVGTGRPGARGGGGTRSSTAAHRARSVGLLHRPPAGATELGDVGLIVLLSIGVAIVATLHPAAQAAKLYPIEAIRSE
jgi:lipoprotein-releasing system permease protein